MATSVTTRHISVASPTLTNRSLPRPTLTNEKLFPLNPNREVSISNSGNTAPVGVPVKFADNLFSLLIKDQLHHLLNSPQIKGLKYTDENAARSLTYEITEILKGIVAQHTKDGYKAVIQVMTYPKLDEQNIFIMNRCLWNYRTDDVLSVETEIDAFKFLIVIHGLVA